MFFLAIILLAIRGNNIYDCKPHVNKIMEYIINI
jgi:hypothetical protein